ncbi:MAG: 2,3-bisphosphoglycerate-independent phosphoglycerate mutase [Gammaproteobacteria bacterium]
MAIVKHPVLLVVLDGWGHSDNPSYNAIHHASTPHWDQLRQDCPHTLIRCSGLSVGLPDDQMGNSEVGHMHLGAGRLIYQDFTRISQAIRTGEFFANVELTAACDAVVATGHSLHVMGLLSPGGVHSHEDHIFAILQLAAQRGVTQVHVHAFLDGRDVPPKSARASLERLAAECARLGIARIASIVGRYYAMDRNKSWDRTRLAYDLLVDGVAPVREIDAISALEAAYARGETDEFIKPITLAAAGAAPARIEDGDAVVFANFRADRARQITSALTDTAFTAFERGRVPRLARFVAMTDYGAQFQLPVAFPTIDIRNTFGEIIARHGLRQLRIAETEKYAHVTFFFNGGEEQPFAGEDRILVPSPQVATYDLKPEMSADEVTDRLVDALRSRQYDAIVCNYANADMVGHTGDFDAAVKCIETLDRCLGRLRTACAEAGTEMLITADHGNAEQMRADGREDAEAHTAHTCNLVPLVYCGRAATLATDGCLSDIAPTLLTLMDLPVPAEMTGVSLVKLTAGRSQHAA